MSHRDICGQIPNFALNAIINRYLSGIDRTDLIIIPPVTGKYCIFSRSAALNTNSGEDLKIIVAQKISSRSCLTTVARNPPIFVRELLKRAVRAFDEYPED